MNIFSNRIGIREIYQFFSSREYWGSKDAFSDTSELPILFLLAMLHRTNEAQLGYGIAKLVSFEKYVLREDAYTTRMRAPASNRRGNHDLKDLTWSAYHYLQARYPGAELDACGRVLPFAYLARTEREAATAGNIGVRQLMEWVCHNNVRTVSMLSDDFERFVPESMQLDWRDRSQTYVATMRLSERAAHQIQRYFRHEQEKARRLLENFYRNDPFSIPNLKNR